MSPLQTLQLNANGLRFTAHAAGKGPLVLCLHGFPDSAHTWDALLPELAGAGYRAVAPFTRGYAPTQIPADGDYSVATLALDVLALADALGERQFYIVGHDWGAVMAYAAAAFAPDRILGICTAALPPFRQFLLNTRAAQARRSWYIGFFQLPFLPELALRKNDCALIDKLWRDWSPGWDYSAADIAPVKEILGQHASCKAALGYYRALPPALVGPRAQGDRVRMFARLDVPARVIRGTQDGCIGTDSFAGTQARFTSPCELHTMTAGHFMHREQPREFAGNVLEFLADSSG